MAKKKKFENPLEGIDPIMEEAFSLAEETDNYDADAHQEETQNDIPDIQDVSNPKKQKNNIKKQAYPPPKESIFIEEEFETYDNTEEQPLVSRIEFPDLTEIKTEKKFDMSVFKNIPVTVTVELGRSQISLKEVFELTEGSIVELERLVGEPLDLVVNGQVIAQGEVVAVDNNYGLRVTNVLSTKDD